MQSFMSVNYFVLKIRIFKETLFGPDKLSGLSRNGSLEVTDYLYRFSWFAVHGDFDWLLCDRMRQMIDR